MWLWMAISSALLFGLTGLWMKVSQMKQGSVHALLLGLYLTGTLGFAIHASAQGTLDAALLDWRYWMAGAVVGAGSAWGNALFMKALDYGPASLTSPLTNINIILVVIMGTWVYDEPLTWAGAVGITLLLLAAALISIRRKEAMSAPRKQWFIYVAIAIILFAFRNGGLKVTEELGMASASVLCIAYLLSIVWFFPPAWREWSAWRRQPAAAALTRLRTGLLWGLLSGLFSYGGLQLYAISLETGQANLAAPIFATNSLVVALGAIVLYRERLTLLQAIALVCMMSGLIIIRL